MGTRMGTRLPMIFVKGHPAKLHEMTLDQLRKFVPFLVKCESRKELPSSADSSTEPPSWWPSKLPFTRSVLYEKKPQKEMTQRLLRIVSRCYSSHNSSYLIAFSSSLASGNCSQTQTFGKLTMVELDDGTTRILNSKGQLVVVVRTTTRNYDREDSRPGKKRRRSARLVTQSAMAGRKSRKREQLESDLEEVTSPVAREGRPSTKRQRKNVERSCRKTSGVVLTDTDTNTMSSEIPMERLSKGYKTRDKSRLRGQVRPQRINPKSPIKLPCKKCAKEFTYQEILEEHETECLSLQDEPSDESRKENFMTALGLLDTSKMLERQGNHVPMPETPACGLKPGSRNLRKVASRSKIGAIIRAQPIPLTSERGQGLLQKFGERMKAGSFDGKRLEYEKHCNSRNYRVPAGPAPTISTLKKHLIKDNQYVHKFSFSRTERIKRDVELTVGLARKSFKLFNKCKRLSIVVKRLPEAQVKEIIERDEKRRKAKEARFAELIKTCLPVIELFDIVKFPLTMPRQYQHLFKSSSS